MNNGTHTGRLIVVCGIDGSGKTLQSKSLYDRLIQNGQPARYMEFPRYEEGFFGDLIARYLRGELGGCAADLDPYLMALPFACDRWECSPRLHAWLGRGETVVCNRYVTANMAHQGGKIPDASARQAFYDWTERMEYEVFSIPRPHKHFWLDIRPEHAMMLIDSKEERGYLNREKDIHENVQHLRTARNAYLELSRRTPDWVTIECSDDAGWKPPEAVAGAIWRHLAGP